MKLERDTYPSFSHFIAKHANQLNASAFELKFVPEGNKSFYFRDLPPHQERALRMTYNGGGVYHKISDESRGTKPFDCFYLKGDAYLVIYYSREKKFFGIHIKELDALRSLDGVKITPSSAEKHATFTLNANGTSSFRIVSRTPDQPSFSAQEPA